MSEACCNTDQVAHSHPAAPSGRNWLMLLVAGAGVAIAAGAALSRWSQPGAALVAYFLAITLTIIEPARGAWRALRRRALDINVLMVIAVIGAAALGDWLEAAVVVWLFAIAEWLEGLSLERARHAIRALMALAPTQALVVRGGREELVAASDVRIGDVVIVRPGERLPVDGRIITGESSIDQASVTGESMPLEKSPGDLVFAGTINGTGALEIEASHPASDSTIARIIHLVERAQARRAPVQTAVDRFARIYTPAVTVLAALLAIVPPTMIWAAGGAHGGFAPAFAVWSYRALALLVVACPCALVISTPVAIISALTVAAREGVLIKGGAHLERLASIRCVAFDKTGTITDGRVSVTDVLGVDGASHAGVLSVAAALESRSEHPIGRAIVDRARGDGLVVVPGRGFRALPGYGAEAHVAEMPAIVGSHRLFEERQLCTPSLHDRIDELTGRGATAVLVGHGGAALGVIGLSGQVRAGGREMVTALREEGIQRIVLLTGDHQESADAAVAATGIDEARADLLPADKMRLVGELRARWGPIAMVGDGVNDAPAMASADIGIAMGVAGADVALETADVALMSDDLSKLPYALRLSRAALRNIRTNVGIAVGLKVAFIALAAFGVATLWMAILADTGASLLVTANGLRLLRQRD